MAQTSTALATTRSSKSAEISERPFVEPALYAQFETMPREMVERIEACCQLQRIADSADIRRQERRDERFVTSLERHQATAASQNQRLRRALMVKLRRVGL